MDRLIRYLNSSFSCFSVEELSSLSNEFQRIAVKRDEGSILVKEDFCTFMQGNRDAHVADYFAESIYAVFDVNQKGGLTKNEFLSVCELFIKGMEIFLDIFLREVEDRLAFMYLVSKYQGKYFQDNARKSLIKMADEEIKVNQNGIAIDVTLDNVPLSPPVSIHESTHVQTRLLPYRSFSPIRVSKSRNSSRESSPRRTNNHWKSRSNSPIREHNAVDTAIYPLHRNSIFTSFSKPENLDLVSGYLSLHKFFETSYFKFSITKPLNFNLDFGMYSDLSKKGLAFWSQHHTILEGIFGAAGTEKNLNLDRLFQLLSITEKTDVEEACLQFSALHDFISEIPLTVFEESHYLINLSAESEQISEHKVKAILIFLLELKEPSSLFVDLLFKGWSNLAAILGFCNPATNASHPTEKWRASSTVLAVYTLDLFLSLSSAKQALILIVRALFGIQDQCSHNDHRHHGAVDSMLSLWALIVISGSNTFHSGKICRLSLVKTLNEFIGNLEISGYEPNDFVQQNISSNFHPVQSTSVAPYSNAASLIIQKRSHAIRNLKNLSTLRMKNYLQARLSPYHKITRTNGNVRVDLECLHDSFSKQFLSFVHLDDMSLNFRADSEEVENIKVVKFGAGSFETFLIDVLFYEAHFDEILSKLYPEVFTTKDNSNSNLNQISSEQMRAVLSLWQSRSKVMGDISVILYHSCSIPVSLGDSNLTKTNTPKDNNKTELKEVVLSGSETSSKELITNEKTIPAIGIFSLDPSSLWFLSLLLFFISSIESSSFYMSNIPGLISTEIVSYYSVPLGAMGELGSFANIGWMISLFTTEAVLVNYGIHSACIINISIQVIACALFLISSYLHSYSVLSIAFLIFGMGDLYLIVAVLITQFFPQSVGLSFSLASAYYMAGTAIGSYLNPFVVSTFGMYSVWVLLAFMEIFVIVSFICFVYMEDIFVKSKNSSTNAPSHSAKDSRSWESLPVTMLSHLQSLSSFKAFFKPTIWTSFRSYVSSVFTSVFKLVTLMRRQPNTMWIFLFYTFISNGSANAPLWYIPGYIESKFGLSSSTSSAISYGAINLGAIFLTPLVGRLFDQYGHRFPVVIICFVLEAISIIILSQTNIFPILFSFLYMGIFSVIRCFGFPVMSLIVDKEFSSYGATLYMIVSGLGATVFALFTGNLLKSEGFSALWLYSYIMIALTIVVLVILWIYDGHLSNYELDQSPNRFRLKFPRLTLRYFSKQ